MMLGIFIRCPYDGGLTFTRPVMLIVMAFSPAELEILTVAKLEAVPLGWKMGLLLDTTVTPGKSIDREVTVSPESIFPLLLSSSSISYCRGLVKKTRTLLPWLTAWDLAAKRSARICRTAPFNRYLGSCEESHVPLSPITTLSTPRTMSNSASVYPDGSSSRFWNGRHTADFLRVQRLPASLVFTDVASRLTDAGLTKTVPRTRR